MLRTNTAEVSARFITSLFVGLFLVVGISLVQATPSHADFSVGIEDGAGSGGAPVSGGGTPWTPAPSPGSGGGGGSTGPAGSYWKYHWGISPCAPRPVVGNAIGYRDLWVDEETRTPSKDQPPLGSGWIFSSYHPGYGAYWNRSIAISAADCLYPPMYQLVTQECILSTNARFDEVEPKPTPLAERTVYSGYSQGTPDPAACAASRTHVALGANIVRYSYVEGKAVSQAVTHTFKVYTEADPRTGSIPATEIVGTVGPYNLPAKQNSASLTCAGPSIPGKKGGDYTENGCSPEKRPFDPSYICSPDAVLFDKRATWETSEEMGPNPDNAIWYGTADFFWEEQAGWTQAKRDENRGRKIVFNQNPQGSGITINSYSTRYERDASSTPFKPAGPIGLADKPLAELDVFHNGYKYQNALDSTGLTTAEYPGKANTVKLFLTGASNPGAPTKITQVLTWTGTREVSTIQITGLNPISGEITYTTSTASVPTSGTCRSMATVDAVKAIGDDIKK